MKPLMQNVRHIAAIQTVCRQQVIVNQTRMISMLSTKKSISANMFNSQ